MTKEQERVAVGLGKRFHKLMPWERVKRTVCGLYLDSTMDREDAASFLLPCARCYTPHTASVKE